MLSNAGLTTAQVLAAFTDEVTARRGQVTEIFDDGRRLLARSVLPRTEHVRPRDQVRAGVALRATGGEVWIHPYLFRIVCRNGAIVAQTLQTRRLVDLDIRGTAEALWAIREVIGTCCDREVFTATVRRMRTACEEEADRAIAMIPLLSLLSTRGNAQIILEIMDRFFREGDRSRFGLANAITATARDAGDPELKWDLEEFGGGIAIGETPPLPDKGPSGTTRRSLAELVG